MSEGIYVERDGELVNMALAPYASEDLLQGLLEKHSVLLAGEQLTPNADPRRFLLVRREAGVPDVLGGGDRWSVDHLFVDQDGIPTLVEVKRSTDTRIRREVVGQMLDYAANAVVYWPVERLRQDLEATQAESTGGVFEQLRTLLGLAETSVDEAESQIEEFWQRVGANLVAGRVRLLFVADTLPPELRRIIEFLNEQMSPADVLGIEISNYEGQGLRALVPRVVGLTEAAKEHKRQVVPSMPIEELWSVAAPEVVEARRLLDDWAVRVGLDQRDLSKSRRYAWPGAPRSLLLLYPADQYRSLYFTFASIQEPAERAALHQSLCDVVGRQLSEKEPGLSCSWVVNNWPGLETFLTPFAAAARA